jgi:nucleotide-binding universal stress UspA family protein
MTPNPTIKRTVVVGVDGSPTADLAVAWGVAAAQRHGATLRLVAAFQDHPFDDAVRDPADRTPAEEPATSRDVALHRLDMASAQARELSADLVIEATYVSGAPTAVLLSASQDAIALMVGSRRRGPLHRLFTPSVGRALAGTASCPVVVVRESPSRSISDTRIVVGVAGPESTRELQLAFEEASRFGAGLTAVHVRSATVPGAGTHTRRRRNREATDTYAMLTRMVTPLSSAYPDVDVRRYVVDGSVADRLVAMSENARLLVLGSGKPRSRSTLGPVSRVVMRRSHCPVAVVHAPPLRGTESATMPDHPAKKVLT